jgi:hypothetical protein
MVSRTTGGKTMPKLHSALTIRDLKAPPTTKLAHGLAEQKNRDREALRKEWQRLFRKKAPLNLPQYILLRMIAYRFQANALGDLDSNCIKVSESGRNSASNKIGVKK